jgi:hypothetical protein
MQSTAWRAVSPKGDTHGRSNSYEIESVDEKTLKHGLAVPSCLTISF